VTCVGGVQRAVALRESLEEELEAAKEALQDAKACRHWKEQEVQALQTELDMLKEKAKTQSKVSTLTVTSP
jgi:hypothetical protein